jgi:membrane carboxypeptidase/penicillin-binding protein
MKAYIARRGRDPMPQFAAPGNIVFLAVDRSTGAPSDDATQAINEAFISGTQPHTDVVRQPEAPPLDGADQTASPVTPP